MAWGANKSSWISPAKQALAEDPKLMAKITSAILEKVEVTQVIVLPVSAHNPSAADESPYIGRGGMSTSGDARITQSAAS